jgi:hypothetical protein
VCLVNGVEISGRRSAKPDRAGGRERFQRQRLTFQRIPATDELRFADARGDDFRAG